jgi:hypothetical protein
MSIDRFIAAGVRPTLPAPPDEGFSVAAFEADQHQEMST